MVMEAPKLQTLEYFDWSKVESFYLNTDTEFYDKLQTWYDAECDSGNVSNDAFLRVSNNKWDEDEKFIFDRLIKDLYPADFVPGEHYNISFWVSW